MISYDDIYDGLISVTKSVIGSRLSTMKTESGTTPSVFRTRSGRPKQDLPYITIDVGDMLMPYGWLLSVDTDDEDKPRYQVLYETFVTWKCVGKDAQSILQQFHGFLSTPSVRDAIKQNTPDLSIHEQGFVQNTPDLLSTKFEDGSTMVTSFLVIDVITDPLQVGGIIDKMKADGILITGVNGDIPVEIRVNTP